MQRIDDQVLQSVSKALRLPLSGAAPLTFFDDGHLQQVLDVTGLLRRGGVLGPTGGLWACGLTNTHAIADTQSQNFDPFAVATPLNGFPSPIPDFLDLWIITPLITLNADVAGTAFFGVQWPASRVGFGISSHSEPLVVISGSAVIAGTRIGTPTTAGPVTARAYRVPRGATLRFDSTSTGAGAMVARFIVGLFPIGLGQDGVG